ncbi:MarR family winged helix-turn-helix transcriptional regulator [Aeromicrobium sp. 9AM]|uniref:MarR family winged helix-turn-helix transcriptional regulator n=1 Tax=Aeromicrobium sp. 9AM TaxID=2653126 RepID=UPI00135B3DA1|nr:MarR family transcriptional regulator [Aeromicrobium sp. 9AM]
MDESSSPSLLYAVKQVEQVVRARLDAVLRPHGATALQYTALTVLQHRDGMSSAELARNAFVRPQSMADLVSALESRRLVVRVKDAADRKRINVMLTDEGRAFLSACEAEVADLERTMLRDLTDHQVKVLRSALNSCRRSLA